MTPTDRGNAPRGCESFPPLRSDWHRLLMIAVHQGFRGRDADSLPPALGQQANWMGADSRFPDVLVVKFLLTFSQAPMLFRACRRGWRLAKLTFVYLTLLYVLTDSSRPDLIAAGVGDHQRAAVAGRLLAELTVSQANGSLILSASCRGEGGTEPSASADPTRRTSPERSHPTRPDGEANVDRVDAGRRYRV